jgi:hypothetical protein
MKIDTSPTDPGSCRRHLAAISNSDLSPAVMQ